MRGITRTPAEIIERMKAIEEQDWLGFAREVLLDGLEFDDAKPWLMDGVTQEQWDAARPENFAEAAASYLTFAIGKVRSHRGISAGRSVIKLREYAWLLGRDDVVAAMDAADYPQYGAPKLYAFACTMDMPHLWPTDAPMLHRMAAGAPCLPDCQEGCAR